MILSAKKIKNCAKAIGFNLCGVVKSAEVKEYDDFFIKWIESGKNGNLSWAQKNHHLRRNPSVLHDSTKSIVVVGLNYHKKEYSKEVSMLANGIDYHYIVKEKLEQLKQQIEIECSVSLNVKMCVDSAPIAEKYWAFKAGIGWIGRNSLLINQEFGSFFVLGELLIDFELDNYDSPIQFNGCANCRKCEIACPSRALENCIVDANLCLASLTTGFRGEFNNTQLDIIKNSGSNSFFGCDICQDICPWNIKALGNFCDSDYVKIKSLFKSNQYSFDRDKFKEISNSEFKKLYGATPLFYVGLKKILTNIKAIN